MFVVQLFQSFRVNLVGFTSDIIIMFNIIKWLRFIFNPLPKQRNKSKWNETRIKKNPFYSEKSRLQSKQLPDIGSGTSTGTDTHGLT